MSVTNLLDFIAPHQSVLIPLLAMLFGVFGGFILWQVNAANMRRMHRDALQEAQRKLMQAEVKIAQQHEQNSIMQRQIFHAQKMEALGRLTAGVAHDFNNLLGAILGYADFLQEDLAEQPDQQRFARNIQSAALQGRQLIDQLLDFVKRESGKREKINLSALVQDVLMLAQGGFPRSVKLQTHIQDWDIEIEGLMGPLHQMLMNIMVNAKDALIDEAGVITVSIAEWQKGNVKAGFNRVYGDLQPHLHYAELTIADTGCGMDEVVMDKMMEPFFTTKASDKGTGLGLATVLTLLEQHDAVLRISSVIGQGSVFSILLPMLDGGSGQAEVIARAPEPGEQAGEWPQTILLVDDQPAIRDMFAAMLRRLGYAVLSASHGEEALAFLQEKGPAIKLVLTDYTMPQITGLDLARQMQEQGHKQPVILMSGYPPEKLEQSAGDLSLFAAVLRKPLERQSLGRILQQILTAPVN